MPHKYDQGAYTVLFFDHLGRKTGEKVANSFTEASNLGKKHDGSYTVIRCVVNSAKNNASWMPRDKNHER
jgi:hypothetical protein